MATKPLYVDIPVVITGTIPIPYDLQDRSDAYGTCVPHECVKIDLTNDASSFFLEFLNVTQITADGVVIDGADLG